MLRGVEPMFGSMVYRRSAIAGRRVAHDEFATLVDRPFLLAIAREVVGRRHPGPAGLVSERTTTTTRHLAMSGEHVLRLFTAYRATFRGAGSRRRTGALFYGYTGYWLFTLYHLVPPGDGPALRPFVFRAWRQGLYDPALVARRTAASA